MLLIQCEQIERLMKQRASIISNVQQIKNSLSKKEENLEAYLPLTKAQAAILSVRETFVSIKNGDKEVEEILNIQSKLISKRKKMKKAHFLPSVVKLINQISEKQKEFSELSSNNISLSNIINKIKTAKERMKLLEGWIEEEKRNLPKNCPTCGAEVKT